MSDKCIYYGGGLLKSDRVDNRFCACHESLTYAGESFSREARSVSSPYVFSGLGASVITRWLNGNLGGSRGPRKTNFLPHKLRHLQMCVCGGGDT